MRFTRVTFFDGPARALLLLSAAAAISGCAHWQKTAGPATLPTQDNSVTEVAPDTFTIQYTGHGKHPAGYVEDQMLLRATEVALEHGYPYIALMGMGSDNTAPASSGAEKQPGRTAAATGYGFYGSGLSPFGSPQMTAPSGAAISSGGTGHRRAPVLTIKCFRDEPSDVIASNAANIQKSIRKKYNMDGPVTTAQL